MKNSPRFRLLVLGASGAVGRLVTAAWRADRVDLRCQSRAQIDTPGWSCFDPLGAPDRLEDAMRAADVALNLAGPVPRAGKSVDLSLHTTLAIATLNAAQRTGLRHVFLASSAAVYGARGGLHRETDRPDPGADYGVAKQAMEAAIGDWVAATHGPPKTTILRIGNIVGADQLLGRPDHEPTLLDRFPDGASPRRSYIGPITLARVLAELVTKSAECDLPPVLNIAAPGSVEMSALLSAAGRAFDTRPAPTSAIPDVTLDTGLLEKLVQFRARDSSPQGMVDEWQSLPPRTGA